MTYTATVSSCTTETVGDAVRYRVMLAYARDSAPLFEECVSIDAAAHPTQVDLDAEIRRVAQAKIAQLEDYDANAAAVSGAVVS